MASIKNKKPVAIIYDGKLWEVDAILEVSDDKPNEIAFLISEGHELVTVGE